MKTSLKFSFALFVFWGLIGLMNASAQGNCIDARKAQPDRTCDRTFVEPVCGCDGNTYASVCDAERKGLTKWKPGTCPGSVEESFTKFGQDWEAAYNKSDYRALANMFAVDAVQFFSDGTVIEGTKNISERYSKIFANQKSEINIKMSDVMPLCEGWVTSSGNYVIEELPVPDQAPDHNSKITKGTFTWVAQQVKGDWKIVRHHVYIEPGRAQAKVKVMEKAKMKAPAPVRN